MLEIEKHNHVYPFSKGIIARSMLPTGLPLETIYGIAEKIEDEFNHRKNPVPASDIQDKVTQILTERGFENEKSRYKISHKIAQINKPLVILIGGTAGVGKSTIAAALTRRIGIRRVIGTDEIREIMRYMLPKDLLPALHESSFDAGEVLGGPDIRENTEVGFCRQSGLVNRGVHAYIKRTEKEGLKTIFNGVHLSPGFLEIKHDESSLLLFQYLLTLNDEEQHKQRFQLRSDGSYREAERYINKIDRIRDIQEYLVKEAKKSGSKIIENTNVGHTVTEIVDDLIANLEKEKIHE
ncbi:MAG TPA: hypothetical protein VKM37_05305 [Balneolaceae bacterium]|nr:hypothetical protein [Balneolaceae bacterium]